MGGHWSARSPHIDDSPAGAIVDGGGWYTYEFETRLSCAIAGCKLDHPLYIGKTNRPWAREDEHAATKGWYPYRCGYRIHDRTYATERDCLAAELEMIHARLPLGNIAGNGRNEHRLDFAGMGPDPRAYRAPARRPSPQPQRQPYRAPSLSRRDRTVLLWFTSWLTLSCALWWSLLAVPATWPWWGRPVAAGAVVALGLGYVGSLSRFKRRRLAWRAVGLGAVAVVGWLAIRYAHNPR